MLTLTTSNIGSTGVDIAIAGPTAGAAKIQVQVSTRVDFMWCLSPVLSFDIGPAIQVRGLNQRCSYFFRARPVDDDGLPLAAWSPTTGIHTAAGGDRVTTPAAVLIAPALIVPPEPVMAWSSPMELAGFPARALGRDDPNSTWAARKSNGVVSFDVQTAGAPADTIAVLESTAGEDCTITVRAAQTQGALAAAGAVVAPAQPFRASANLPGRRGYHSLVRLAAPVARPWWRVEIRGSMPAETFVATYAVIGLARKTHNFVADSRSETILDAGSVDRDRSGNPARTAGFRGRTVDFEVAWLTEQEYETQFERIRWLLGTTEAALVVPNSKPGAFLHDRMLYGQLAAQGVTGSSSLHVAQPFRVQSLI